MSIIRYELSDRVLVNKSNSLLGLLRAIKKKLGEYHTVGIDSLLLESKVSRLNFPKNMLNFSHSDRNVTLMHCNAV